MDINEELDEIYNVGCSSEDLAELAASEKRCETLLGNLTASAPAQTDPAMREHLAGLADRARDALQVVKQRRAEISVARMDPDYDKRKAQAAEAERRKKLEDLEKAKQFLSGMGGGGLGGLLGGFMDAAMKAQGGGAAAPASAPAAGACSKCGAAAGAGKFCQECGAPVARERKCACGAKLDPAAKFCAECGAKAA